MFPWQRIAIQGFANLRPTSSLSCWSVSHMRKAIFFGFIATGAVTGLFVAMNGDWGLRVVMMSFGALVGAAIGGALAKFGRRGQSGHQVTERTIPGMGTASEDLAANFWRDKGHPPFMKPPSVESGQHMFDPSRPD